ncbi:MAG: hypothetical protein R3F05_04630 [Planctomycetota bacterium]
MAGFVLLLMLGACGDGDLRSDGAPSDIPLPVVGTLGRTPVGPAVIRIDVDQDGRMSIDGEGPLSLAALRSALREATQERGWSYPDGSSRKLLLINADARVPWVAPWTILLHACEPRTQIWQFFLAARATADGRLGALGFSLPHATRRFPVRLGNPPTMVSALVLQREGPGEAPDSVMASVAQALAAHPKGWVTVRISCAARASGAVPTGYVAAVMDAALRAGARRLDPDGGPRTGQPGGGDDEPPWFADDDVEGWLRYVAWFKARPGEPTVRVRILGERGGDEAAAPVAPSRPQGVLDRLYGSDVPISEPPPLDASEQAEPVRLTGLEDPDTEAMPDTWILAEFADDVPRRAPSEPDEDPPPLAAALAWLATQQRPDHGWSPDGAGSGDVGVTARVLLAYLGAGYTSRGAQPFALPISQGFRFLKLQQDEEGCYGPQDRRDVARDHALAQLAMVEMYRRTRSPIVASSLRRALAFTHASHGKAWGMRGDDETSAWMALGLWSATQSAAFDREHGRTPRLEVDPSLLASTVRRLGGAPGIALRVLAGIDEEVREALPPESELLSDPRPRSGARWRRVGATIPLGLNAPSSSLRP